MPPETARDAIEAVIADSPNWEGDDWALDFLAVLGIPADAARERVEIALWLLDQMEKWPGTGGMGKNDDGTVYARYGDWIGSAPTLVEALVELRAALADDPDHLAQYDASQEAGLREWRDGVLSAAAEADATVEEVEAGIAALRMPEGISIGPSAPGYGLGWDASTVVRDAPSRFSQATGRTSAAAVLALRDRLAEAPRA